MTPVLGAVVGAHRLEGIVTSDALGTVYAARDEQSGRQLLVRLLHPLASDPAGRRRFQIEMAAIAGLDHPSILRIEDWGEWEGVPYVVTADVGAQRLSAILASGRRLHPRFVTRTLRDLGAALDHAHRAGVVHGDVEPAAVLVNADGSVLLSDFGLTLLVGASPDRDVYGLTAIARDLLALAPPPPPSRPSVDAVLWRGLADDPEQRWETCGAMVDALQVVLSGRSAESSTASTPWSRLRLRPLPELLRSPPRLLPLWIGIGAAVLVLLVIAFMAAHAMRPSPSLALSVGSARVGDTVAVTGANLPAGQPGTIVLQGRAAPLAQFSADEKGAFRIEFVVPLDVSGSRTVDACWGGSCPLSQVLVVQAQPTPAPTATVAPLPVQTATPPSATPVPHRFAPEIGLNRQTPHRDETITVSGRGFDPAQQYVIVLQQGDRRWVLQSPASPDGDGAFSDRVQIPGDARRGFGAVAACISLTGTGQTTSCAQQPVFIGQ
ncbi:MAG TPA: protein kinase [Candidatus Dormibacteraeota bacterium]